ncbi:MAG: FHA domain-containing protein [Acidobacteria bacterium]|nr:FHA domain-containing protein [Acidobacteriota bacterium]
MRQCPHCGRTYTDDSLLFCLDDGTSLAKVYDPQATVITRDPDATLAISSETVTSLKPKLWMLKKGNEHLFFTLDNYETVIGRDFGDIRYPKDDAISSIHARIVRRENGYLIFDHNSRNGIFKKVRCEAELTEGDVFFFGGQHFKVNCTSTGDLELLGIEKGEVTDKSFKLEKEQTIIGRSYGHIRFPGAQRMSPSHACIVQRKDKLLLIDISTSMGIMKKSFLEDELKTGDILLIGLQLMKFEI